jgi:hypothetical protein
MDSRSRILDALENRHVFLAEAQRLHHEYHEVRVGQRRGGGAVHGPVQGTALAEMQSRRVDEGQLHAGPVEHAEHAMARGLRARRDDRHLLADQSIDQRRLADIGTADQRGESRAKAGWTGGHRGFLNH